MGGAPAPQDCPTGRTSSPKSAIWFDQRGAVSSRCVTRARTGEILIYSDIGDSMWGGLSAQEFLAAR